MAAKVVELCDAIVSYLNNQTLSQSFTAVRRNVWFTNLEDTEDVQVVVIPTETETSTETRDSSQRRFRVNVVVQKRITSTTEMDDQDAMLLLMEEIENALYGEGMGSYGFDTFSETAGSRQLIDIDGMATERTFRTVLQISYLGL